MPWDLICRLLLILAIVSPIVWRAGHTTGPSLLLQHLLHTISPNHTDPSQDTALQWTGWDTDEAVQDALTIQATVDALGFAKDGTCRNVGSWKVSTVPLEAPQPYIRLNTTISVGLSPPTPEAFLVSAGKMLPGTKRLNREWQQVYQGLTNHPFVKLTVLSLDASLHQLRTLDWLVLLTPFTVSIFNLSWIGVNLTRQTIIIDFSDNKPCSKEYPWYDIPPYHSLVFYKRSFVRRSSGRTYPESLDCPLNVAPMHYAIFDQWVLSRTVQWDKRPYDVVCTLRARESTSSPYSGGRLNVVTWLNELRSDWPYKMHIGPLTKTSDNCIDLLYLRLLHQAKILITCQPPYWETDFRTWEALSSGALVFTDYIGTPMAFAPIDKVHWIVYDALSKDDFTTKLKYYIDHPEEAWAIACAGRLHALRYHRTASRMDEVLWTATLNKSRTMILGTILFPRKKARYRSHRNRTHHVVPPHGNQSVAQSNHLL